MMRSRALLVGLVGAGLVVTWLRTRPPPQQPPVPVDRAALSAVAQAHLPAPGDSAAIIDLRSGALLLRHHVGALQDAPIVPGSVMKLFTGYALVEAGRADSMMECQGQHRGREGLTRPCWDQRGHGPMRLRTAIAESCNVWFYEQSAHLDASQILGTYARFGLGAPWPPGGISKGAVHRDVLPATLPARDLPDVIVGDHVSLRVTALSLLRAVSVIASQGLMLQPHLDDNAGLIAPTRTDLDPSTLALIAEGMREATLSGTLKGVFDPSLQVAAKTGTAKKFRSRGTRGLVVGYLPAQSPRYAFVVVKDDGQGAKDAGPPAAAITVALMSAPR